MKARGKEMALAGVRVNMAGCLDRCEFGPAMVIYPEGIWYKIETKAILMKCWTRIFAKKVA
jgi:hypothetical protein